MITPAQRIGAVAALRKAGFNPSECRELLAGPKGLRDELAGQAMSAIIITDKVVPDEGEHVADAISNAAYTMADAMIERRTR